jgi:hypothetical protein
MGKNTAQILVAGEPHKRAWSGPNVLTELCQLGERFRIGNITMIFLQSGSTMFGWMFLAESPAEAIPRFTLFRHQRTSSNAASL